MSEPQPLVYCGLLRKGDDPDTIEGSFTDSFGFEMVLKGRRVQGGYQCEVRGGKIPQEFLIPHLDDERAG